MPLLGKSGSLTGSFIVFISYKKKHLLDERKGALLGCQRMIN